LIYADRRRTGSWCSIFFLPGTALARVMAPLDLLLGELTTLGAASVAVQATKP
jgi:hypothetical protein